MVLEDFPEFAVNILKHGVQKLVDTIPFFKTFSPEMRQKIASLLAPLSFSAGPFIFSTFRADLLPQLGSMITQAGEEGNCMYFLCKGTAEVISADGRTVFKVLHEGEHFGEHSLLFSQRRTATVRAISQCNVFILERTNFQVLNQYPEFQNVVASMQRNYIFK